MTANRFRFRAWWRSERRMVHSIHGVNEFLFNGDGFRGVDYRAGVGRKFLQPMWLDIIQSTGLLDKSGKEIFEGDILRRPARTAYEDTTYNSWEVFYHDNDATPTDCGLVFGRLTPHGNSAGGATPYRLRPSDMAQLEIIGNIYENPELIESP